MVCRSGHANGQVAVVAEREVRGVHRSADPGRPHSPRPWTGRGGSFDGDAGVRLAVPVWGGAGGNNVGVVPMDSLVGLVVCWVVGRVDVG
jgi:hypothetical protein